jgi:hypothetical protein
MRKEILVLAVGLVSLLAFAADAPAPIPRRAAPFWRRCERRGSGESQRRAPLRDSADGHLVAK